MLRSVQRITVQRITVICLSVLLIHGLVAQATTKPVTDALLQTYLMIYEIDREVERLQVRAEKISAEIAYVETQVEARRQVLADKRTRAADVLRAYYLGERDDWWTLVFSTRSLTDALYVLDVLDTMFANDMARLKSHFDELQRLETLLAKRKQRQLELAANRKQLLVQRTRVLSLQNELNMEISKRPDAAAVLTRLKAFANEWQTRGLPLFDEYFSALARSVNGLPQYIIENKQFRGTRLFILDGQLNDYLRRQNRLFTDTEIQFRDGQVIVSGSRDGLSVRIAGRYRVEQQPVHAIRFTIDELRYQDYRLPDTTIGYLSRKFDLSIYPQAMTNMVRAKAVTVTDGKLTIELILSF